jgi:hypothetical protein
MDQILKKTLLMLCLIGIIAAGIPAALAENNVTNATNVTASPTATLTVTPAVTTPVVTTPPVATTPGKFRVGPSVTLRPVTDVIEANQDGIVELFMNNPSLNDVTLNVDARISVPSGIHVYGESFGQAAGAGVVAGTFIVPPGTSRTIIVVIKADKSARIGSHTLQFTGLYWPGDNKDNYQPLSLTYPVTVKAPSKNPESADPSNPDAVPKTETAGKDIPLTWIILAAVILLGIAVIFGLGRRPPKTEVNLQQ